MRCIGLLWDSVTANVGDQAIGLVLQRALEQADIAYRIINPFGISDLTDVATLVIGGGELIRAPGHPFYDVYRTPGRHILNTVGVLDGKDTGYLQDYRLVTVRSQVDRERMGHGQISPCLTMLYDAHLPSSLPSAEIPEGALGIHLTAASLGDSIAWIDRLGGTQLGPVVWLSLTPYNADRALMSVLAERVPGSVVFTPKSPDEAFQVIGQLHGLVSTSLHATIFAYLQGVPFLSYANEGKIHAFLEDRGLSDRGFSRIDQALARLEVLQESGDDLAAMLEEDRACTQETLERILDHCRAALESDGGSIVGPSRWASEPYHSLEMRFYAQQGELAAHYLRASMTALEGQRQELLAVHDTALEEAKQAHEAELKDIYEQLGTGLYETRRELLRIYSTQAWRVVRLWWRIKDKFFPPGSRRLELYERLRSGVMRQNVLEHKVHNPAYARLLRRSLPRPRELQAQRRVSGRWETAPTIDLISVVEERHMAHLAETAHSIRAQSYPGWSWIIVDAGTKPESSTTMAAIAAEDARIVLIRADPQSPTAEQYNLGVRQGQGPYLAILTAGDLLSPDALYTVASALRNAPDLDVIYSDYDQLDHAARLRQPRFKPDWSPETMLSVNLLDHFCVLKKAMWETVGGMDVSLNEEHGWDLALRIAQHTSAAHHIPRILYHMRVENASMAWGAGVDRETRIARREVLLRELQRRGLSNPGVEETVFQTLRVTWAADREHLISIIIPTRDRAELLKRCLSSIFERSGYENYEVVLVDTGSEEERTWELYRQFEMTGRLRVVRFEGPFNFSTACNLGARQSQGELLLFLNNDTEVLHDDWLERLAQWFQLGGVGAVGAKLIYPDRKLQHAGVIVGLGGMASHLFQGEYEPVASMFGSDMWYRNMSAVTAACLLIDRGVFEKVGGFDEGFQLNYSDVDLCLKVRRAGWRIVYTPDARLTHAESRTHGRRIPRADFERASERWRAWGMLEGDPFFNPNLSYKSAYPLFNRASGDNPRDLNQRLMARLPKKEMLQLPEDIR